MSAAVRRYVVFLRGVNVGGVTLTSEKLLHIAHAAGFEHARTLYLGYHQLGRTYGFPPLAFCLHLVYTLAIKTYI